ncbi:MAG: AAA family ATPase, partial [Siphonobacter aquaeclarae]|nr:AAA family ATPase [Siphonobacter aquaeclarae]
MKLEYFLIKGFRRIRETKIVCGEATFLIGENNIGKSSVLAAMEIFFSSQSNLDPQDYFFCEEPFHQTDEVVLEAKFSDLPVEAQKWKGFKGRIFTEEINDIQTDCIYYRKTFSRNAPLKREMKSRRKSLKDQYGNCKSFS